MMITPNKEIKALSLGKENITRSMLEPVAEIATTTFGSDQIEKIELLSYRPCEVAIEYQHGAPALMHMQYTFRVTPKHGEFDRLTIKRP